MFQIVMLWDSVTLSIVLGGSMLVWLIRFVCKRKWSFFTRNISLFLGAAYSAVWGIQLVLSGNAALILPLAVVPVLYGIILKLVFDLSMFLSQRKEVLRLQAEMEEQYDQQKKAYFTLMLEKENETKRFRHDILNHLLCVQDQLKRGKYPDAESYLDSVLKELNTIREMQYDVGNEVVNVLLNYYLIPVRDKCNVTVEGYLGKLESTSQMDLCTIVSNLLKNAVEAAKSDGEILVNAIRKEKFVQIEIINAFEFMPQTDKTGGFITSKSDKANHGYGISNVKKAILKNHGDFQYYTEDHRFHVEIRLPI